MPLSDGRVCFSRNFIAASMRSCLSLQTGTLSSSSNLVRLEDSAVWSMERLFSLRRNLGLSPSFPLGPVPTISLFTPADFIYCAMDREFIGSIAEEIDCNCSTIPSFRSGVHNASIEAILQLLSEELQTGAPSGTLYADSLAHALGVRFVLADGVAGAVGVATTSGLPPHILIRVQDRIEAELGHALTLEELSQESGYSKSHFLRMFQSAVGQTPYQYLLGRRLHRARQFLKEKHLTVAEVALSCGFSSQAHMTDTFRKHLRTTPGEFRRNSSTQDSGTTAFCWKIHPPPLFYLRNSSSK